MGGAVLFDFDGTLLNNVDLRARAWCGAIEAQTSAAVPYREVRAAVGRSPLDPLQALPVELFAAASSAALREHALLDYRAAYFARARPFVMVAELFEKLSRLGVQRVVVSASPRDETLMGLERAGITALVDHVVVTEPAPADAAGEVVDDRFVRAAALLQGCGRLIAVGDSPADLHAATLAGLPVLALLSGGFDAAALRAAGCDALYEDCAELLQRLGSWHPVLRVPAATLPPPALIARVGSDISG